MEKPKPLDAPNTRDPKEVPKPANIEELRKGMPGLSDAWKLFRGSGPKLARDVVAAKLVPKTQVDEHHAAVLKELQEQFSPKENRTLESLAVVNQTQSQLLRLRQVNDKSRVINADEELAASGREIFFTILPSLVERNLNMLDRYLDLKKQYEAYGITMNPATEKAVKDQLKIFNDATTARLALWGQSGAAVEKATTDLQNAVNPLAVLVNNLYAEFIDLALRKNNELVLKKAEEYQAELTELAKKGTVSDADKNLLMQKHKSQIEVLQKQAVVLGIELESLLLHNGLENIADIEEFTIPEGQRTYKKPAPVEKAPTIPTATAAAAEAEKIVRSSVDALTENFRGHFDMVLGPRNGRPATGYEKDHLLSTKRWDIAAEDLWTEKASVRAATLLNLLAKYRGGVRSMVVNGPRKVAVGITRKVAGDAVADTLDMTMKGVISTKEGGEYAKEHMKDLIKAMGLPEGFDLTSAKDWKDLDEDKRWPGAKKRHDEKMQSVKSIIEKFRKDVEAPAKDFETDLDVLDALRKKTDPARMLGQRADPALVAKFQAKGLTKADIDALDPKNAPEMLAAYVALYLQMRGHWQAYCRAMGGLEKAVMGNIQAHQDKADAANTTAANMQDEDDGFLKWLVFGAAGLATAYVIGGRGGAARLAQNKISMRRPMLRILNGLPSLVDRTLVSGPIRGVEGAAKGSGLLGRGARGVGGYLHGFLWPGLTPAERQAILENEVAALKKDAKADKAYIRELEEEIAGLKKEIAAAADEVVVDEGRVEADASGRSAEALIDPAAIDLGTMDAKAVAELAVKLDIKVDGRTDTAVRTDVAAALKAKTHPKIKK